MEKASGWSWGTLLIPAISPCYPLCDWGWSVTLLDLSSLRCKEGLRKCGVPHPFGRTCETLRRCLLPERMNEPATGWALEKDR